MFLFQPKGSWLVASAPEGSPEAAYIEAKRAEHPDRQFAVRCKPGDERFVLADFERWLSGRPAKPSRAEKEAKAAKAEARRTKAAEKLREVIDWATRLAYDMDFKEGLSGREEVGPLTSLANEAAQLLGEPGPALAGVPWTEKPGEILLWASSLTEV